MEEIKEDTSGDIHAELDSIRKKDRIKIAILAFTAGLMVAIGAIIYMTEAGATSNSTGYNSGVDGSYVDYTTSPAGSSSGSAGGSCCGSSSSGSASISPAELQKQALEAYKKETGATDVTAKASDYGCHTQIDITDKSGKIVRSYGFQGGPLYVIS